MLLFCYFRCFVIEVTSFPGFLNYWAIRSTKNKNRRKEERKIRKKEFKQFSIVYNSNI